MNMPLYYHSNTADHSYMTTECTYIFVHAKIAYNQRHLACT